MRRSIFFVITTALIFLLRPANLWTQVNTFPYNDSFESYSGLPSGNWTVSHVSGKGTTDWTIGSTGGEARTGTKYANSSGPVPGAKKRLDLSVSFSGYIVKDLTYYLKRTDNTNGDNPNIKVQWSSDGVNYTTFRTIDVKTNITHTGYTQFVDALPAALNNTGGVTLRWEYDKDSGSLSASVRLDDVQITVEGLIPVELTSFNASAANSAVTLTWSTATETENLGFHIFRSKAEDGSYEKITQELIPGAGNSAETHTYSYTDYDVETGKTYYYKLADVDFNGNLDFHGPVSVTVAALPTEYALDQNYPNPFNPETNIRFALKEAGDVNLSIYNLQGQLVRTLESGHKEAGSYSVMWNGADQEGRIVASGVYIYKLQVNGFSDSKRLVFMK